MRGLASQALDYMRKSDDAVDIRIILGIAKEIFVKYQGRTDSFVGYVKYLRNKLNIVIRVDGEFFKQEDFVKGFGQVPEFDKFMVQQMVTFLLDVIQGLKREDIKGKVVKVQRRQTISTMTRVETGFWHGTGTVPLPSNLDLSPSPSEPSP